MTTLQRSTQMDTEMYTSVRLLTRTHIHTHLNTSSSLFMSLFSLWVCARALYTLPDAGPFKTSIFEPRLVKH